MKPKPHIVSDGPDRIRPVDQKDSSCSGYVLRVNKQGFIWKQVCSCCARSAHKYYPLELRTAA
jgi:hypothetical protein